MSTVELDTIDSNILNERVGYRIYRTLTEPHQQDQILLYLMHGHGGSDDDWFTKEEGDVQSIWTPFKDQVRSRK